MIQRILLGWFLACSLAALGEDRAPAAKRRVIYKKSESHKFGGISLKGELKKPDLDYIYKRKGLRQEQIVNIPEDFDHEIIQGTGKF